jgi:hypothetical protein
MSIRLHVKWPNASHLLLQNPTVTVLVDDAAITALSQAPGDHQFDIPDGSLSVRVTVDFKVRGNDRTGAAFESVVLAADQAFVVLGSTLVPDPLPFRMVNGEIVSQNVHPLIDVISTGNVVAGVSIAEVRTEFVDVSFVWRVVAHPGQLAEFDADTEREIAFVAIGATGNTPPVWFASFPLGLSPPAPEVGTLVFFRPSATSGYTRIGNMNGFEVQAALNRYLLSPRDSRTPLIVNGAAQRRDPQNFFFVDGPTAPIFLRASFQRSLAQSGKPIVMLHPWPQGGTNFGEASTAKLPTILKGILRFLRGMGFIGGSFANTTPGRLGLAGYSAGGPATYAALRANAAFVRELYLFDTMFLVGAADAVIQWATRTTDFRLRMTGEVSFASMHAIRNSVLKRVSGEAGDAFVSALPETKARYLTEPEGGWAWWNFAIQKIPEDRFNFDNHHQYVLYGGTQFEVGPDATVLSFTPFMEEFLRGSGY